MPHSFARRVLRMNLAYRYGGGLILACVFGGIFAGAFLIMLLGFVWHVFGF